MQWRFTHKRITILNWDLPGMIVIDGLGGYAAPKEAIKSLLFVNCGEVTIKPWKNKQKSPLSASVPSACSYHFVFWYLETLKCKNTWLLTITGCGVTVVRLVGTILFVFPGIFNGSTIGEGTTAGWGGGHFTSCFAALFLWGVGGLEGFPSFWLFAVRTLRGAKIGNSTTTTTTRNKVKALKI